MRAVLKRSISKGGAMSATGKISLVLGAILGFAGMPSIPAEASENATFECLAGPAQICYYGILRPPGRVQSFVVQGHQRLTISGLAPGNDVYMVAIDHAIPAGVDLCRRASFRCKVGMVHRGTNQ